jgi:hypothetical protein
MSPRPQRVQPFCGIHVVRINHERVELIVKPTKLHGVGDVHVPVDVEEDLQHGGDDAGATGAADGDVERTVRVFDYGGCRG